MAYRTFVPPTCSHSLCSNITNFHGILQERLLSMFSLPGFSAYLSFLGDSSQDTYIVVSPVPSILDSKALFLERSILTSISNGLDHSHINILYPSFLLFFFVMSLFIFFTLLNVFLSPQLE